MIVTCPNCASKYRVQDEKVPQEGAQLRCPECDQMFLARPPKKGEVDVARVVETLRGEKDKLATELLDTKRIVDGLREELDRRKADVAQLMHDKGELVNELQDAENRVSLAQDGLETARGNSRATHEALQRAELGAKEAQKYAERLQADLGLAQQTIQALKQTQQRLQTESQLGGVDSARVEELEREIERLRLDGKGVPANVKAILDAVTPMVWGLEQAIAYIEPFAPNQAALVNHLKHLKLLANVLNRLKETLV